MNPEIKKESGIVTDEDAALAAVLKRGGVDPEHLAVAVMKEMGELERPEPLSAKPAIIKTARMRHLRDLFLNPKFENTEHLCQQLIEYAQAQEDKKAYWQGCIREYKKSLRQIREKWDSREGPAPQINHAQEAREQLMVVFEVEDMDANTIKLVESLIRILKDSAFQPDSGRVPAPEPTELDDDEKDVVMIGYLRCLVERDSMELGAAYTATDRFFKKSDGTTCTSINRLAVKTALKKKDRDALKKNLRETAGYIEGEHTAALNLIDQLKHPELIKFLEKYSKRRPT